MKLICTLLPNSFLLSLHSTSQIHSRYEPGRPRVMKRLKSGGGCRNRRAPLRGRSGTVIALLSCTEVLSESKANVTLLWKVLRVQEIVYPHRCKGLHWGSIHQLV